MPEAPLRRSTPAACALNNPPPDLLATFIQQLSWLASGAQETKLALTRWLLATPSPPFRTAAALAAARHMTSRHLQQLAQLLPDIPLAASASHLPVPAVGLLLEQGEACSEGGEAEAVRLQRLLHVVRQLSTCFGAACTSAGQTAIALGRVDLAAVLGSWSAAWQTLRQSLGEDEASLPVSAKL